MTYKDVSVTRILQRRRLKRRVALDPAAGQRQSQDSSPGLPDPQPGIRKHRAHQPADLTQWGAEDGGTFKRKSAKDSLIRP